MLGELYENCQQINTSHCMTATQSLSESSPTRPDLTPSLLQVSWAHLMCTEVSLTVVLMEFHRSAWYKERSPHLF